MGKKRIGMLVACEIEAVLRKYGVPEEEFLHGSLKVRKYTASDYEIYVLHSGVGEIAAAAGTQLLISLYGVNMVLNFGVVGGLTEEMAKARSCVITKVVHYDFDTSPLDPVKEGQYSEFPDEFIPVSEKLVKTALLKAPDLKPVVCASGDKFIADPEKKRALHEKFGADICEMESAAIALTCFRNGVPCLMIKTVSDGVTGGAEEFSAAISETSDIALSIADQVIGEI